MAGPKGLVFDDLQQKKTQKCNKWLAYGISKLCNVQFAFEFDKRYGKKLSIECFSVHPGAIMTEFLRGWQNKYPDFGDCVSILFVFCD